MALGNLPIAANGLSLVPLGNDIQDSPTVGGGGRGGTLIFWRKFLRGWTIFIFMEGHLYIEGVICLDFKGVGNPNTA